MNIEPTSATAPFRAIWGPSPEAPLTKCKPEEDTVEIGKSPRRVRSVSCVWSEGTVLSRAGNILVVKWDNGSISYLHEGDFVWI